MLAAVAVAGGSGPSTSGDLFLSRAFNVVFVAISINTAPFDVSTFAAYPGTIGAP